MWSTSARENRSPNPLTSAPGRYSGARPQCSARNRPRSPTQRASASPPASSLPSLAVGLVGVAIPELPDVGPVEGARVAGVHHHAGVAGPAGGGHVALVEGARVGGVHHHAGVAGPAGGGHVALVEGARVGDVHHRARVPGAAEGGLGLGLVGGLDLLVPDVLGVRRHGRSFPGWPALRRGPSLSTHTARTLTPTTERCSLVLMPGPRASPSPGGGARSWACWARATTSSGSAGPSATGSPSTSTSTWWGRGAPGGSSTTATPAAPRPGRGSSSRCSPDHLRGQGLAVGTTSLGGGSDHAPFAAAPRLSRSRPAPRAWGSGRRSGSPGSAAAATSAAR